MILLCFHTCHINTNTKRLDIIGDTQSIFFTTNWVYYLTIPLAGFKQMKKIFGGRGR